nr:hypothetical protein [Desulfobulbaceae bacterium]
MDIDTHLRNAFRFIKEEPLYAILGSLIVLVMNVATIGLLSGPIIGGYFIGVLKFVRDDQKPVLNDLFAGFQRLGYLFSFILVSILTIFGFLLLVIPGLVMMTWWIYVLLLMIDTNMPLSQAMAVSRKKVQEKGFFRHFVFIAMLAVLPTLIINLLALFLPPLKLLQLVVMPIQSACVVSLYVEQFSRTAPPPMVEIPSTNGQ